jgi:hypothetical protein
MDELYPAGLARKYGVGLFTLGFQADGIAGELPSIKKFNGLAV